MFGAEILVVYTCELLVAVFFGLRLEDVRLLETVPVVWRGRHQSTLL